MKTNVLVPVICSLAGLYFLTMLCISLLHSLKFERFQILASGTFSILWSDGCFPDAGGGATMDAM